MREASVRRRVFLRGLGAVSLGLPLLEAWSPRRVRAADMPRCAVFIRQGNGVAQAGNGEPERF